MEEGGEGWGRVLGQNQKKNKSRCVADYPPGLVTSVGVAVPVLSFERERVGGEGFVIFTTVTWMESGRCHGGESEAVVFCERERARKRRDAGVSYRSCWAWLKERV